MEVLASFLLYECALGLCGMCSGEFGVHAAGYKAGPLGEQTREFKVQSPRGTIIGH